MYYKTFYHHERVKFDFVVEYIDIPSQKKCFIQSIFVNECDLNPSIRLSYVVTATARKCQNDLELLS